MAFHSHSCDISKRILKGYQDLYKESKLCDLTIELLDGSEIQVHATYLSILSSFFDLMLTANMQEKTSRRVKLTHLHPDHVRFCIDFVYGLPVVLERENAIHISSIAHYLNLEILTKYCQEFFKRHFSTQQLNELYDEFERFSWTDIMDELNSQVTLGMEGEVGLFSHFSANRLSDVLRRETCDCVSEDIVVQVLGKWLGEQEEELEGPELTKLFRCVRQLYLSSQGLSQFQELATKHNVDIEICQLSNLSSIFDRLVLREKYFSDPRSSQHVILHITGPVLDGPCLSLTYIDPHHFGDDQIIELPNFRDRTVELQCYLQQDVLFLHETISNMMFSYPFKPSPSYLHAIDLAGLQPPKEYPGVPESLTAFKLVWAEGKLYSLGGKDSQLRIKNLIFHFDPVSEEWHHVWKKGTREPLFLPMPLCQFSVLVHNDLIYITGGRTVLETGEKVAVRNTIEFNPREVTFFNRQPMNSARYGHSSHVVTGNLLVFGGMPDSSAEIKFHTAEMYSESTDQWTIVTCLESLGPCYPLTATVNNRLYYLGRPHGRQRSDEGLWCYEPIANSFQIVDKSRGTSSSSLTIESAVCMSLKTSASSVRRLRDVLQTTAQLHISQHGDDSDST